MTEINVDVGHIVADAVDAARRLGPPEIREISEPITGAKALVRISPDGVGAVDPDIFDAYRAAPRRREGTARLVTLDSFVAHTNRFKSPQSAIFADADPKAPYLLSILDYHPEGPAAEAVPDFGEHRGIYRFPLSPEWARWTGADTRKMSMTDFAIFLEDNIGDVVETADEDIPEDMAKFANAAGYTSLAGPSRLIELSRGLTVNEKAEVREVRNLQSGEAQLLFASEHVDAAGAPLVVPNLFILALPVFKDDGYYRVLARLRYRKAGGTITFHYELWRADRVFDDAVRRAADRAAEATGLPLFYGHPED
jgi:hypothetical protein